MVARAPPLMQDMNTEITQWAELNTLEKGASHALGGRA